jgi:hypothetical protein
MIKMTPEEVHAELFDIIVRLEQMYMDTLREPYMNAGFDSGILWSAARLIEHTMDPDYAPLKKWRDDEPNRRLLRALVLNEEEYNALVESRRSKPKEQKTPS